MVLVITILMTVLISHNNFDADDYCDHHHRHLLLLLLLVTPLAGPEIDPGVSGPPINCLKEVIESATLNPFCYPNSYLSELQLEAAVPDFH